MRVLIVNSYEYPSNLLADSSFTFTKRLIEAFPDDVFFTWVVPDTGVGGFYKYAASSEVEPPERCRLIRVPLFSTRPLSELLISNRLFELINPVNGEFCDYDIILTNNGMVAQRLTDWARTMPGYEGSVPRPPVLCVDYSTPFLGKDCEQGYLRCDKVRMLTHYLGYMNADATTFFTPYCRKRCIRQAKAFFSAGVVKEAVKKFYTVPALFSKEVVARNLSRKREALTVYWGGRLTATKRVSLALEVADYLFGLGRKLQMVATFPSANISPSRIMVGKYAHLPKQLEVHTGLTQEEAMRVMSSCHVSVFPQSLRFGPAAPLEQLSAGLIVLINRKDSEGVLPQSYPWYWSSKIELHALLRRVVSNYEEESRRQLEWKEYVDKNLSLETQVDKLVGIMRAVVAEQDRKFDRIVSPLLSGRVGEVREPVLWSVFRKRLLEDHKVFSRLRSSMAPYYLAPALWPVYKILRTRCDADLVRPDPLFSRRES